MSYYLTYLWNLDLFSLVTVTVYTTETICAIQERLKLKVCARKGGNKEYKQFFDEHRVLLTNLSPDTQLTWAVGSQFAQWLTSWFAGWWWLHRQCSVSAFVCGQCTCLPLPHSTSNNLPVIWQVRAGGFVKQWGSLVASDVPDARWAP